MPVALLLGQFNDLVAHGLRAILAGDDRVEVLATDIPMAALGSAVAEVEPDVAIIDAARLGTPVAVHDLASAHPETALVMLVDRPSAAEAGQFISFGATAVVTKDSPRDDLLTAILMASRGMSVIPAFRGGVESEGPWPDLLTAREAEVLELVQRGKSNAEIALELAIGVETVKTHVAKLLRKLGVSSRKDLKGFGPLGQPF